MVYETYKINESDFTPSVTIANQFTEVLTRTVVRGTVDGIIAGREFYGLIYGYEQFSDLAATGTGIKVKTLADTKGVADNPFMGTAAKSSDEIYVYEGDGLTKLGTVKTQLDDAAAPGEGEWSLSADRKTINVYHTTGTLSVFNVFYLPRSGTLRLDVKNGDKSIRRQLMTWRLNQINEHDYTDVNQKVIMPNAWLIEERYIYGFSVNAPMVIKTPATTFPGDTLQFDPGRISLWIVRGDWHKLSPNDKEMVKSYSRQMR